jgi:hypothetical protein
MPCCATSTDELARNDLSLSLMLRDQNTKGRLLSDDGLGFTARLGSSSAHRPAYDAERNDANDDDQKVQTGGHEASMADRLGISK